MELACLFLVDALHTRGYMLKTIDGQEITDAAATKMAACEILPDNRWPISDCRVPDLLKAFSSTWVLAEEDLRAEVDRIRKERRRSLAPHYEDDWRLSAWGLELEMKPTLIFKVIKEQINLEMATHLTGTVDLLLYKDITSQAKTVLKEVELWPTSDLTCTPLCYSLSPPCQLVDPEELKSLRVEPGNTASLSILRPVSRFLGLPLGTIVKSFIVFPGNPGIWQYRTVTMTK